MHTLQKKLRVIYLPFLLIALGCVVGYSFLNWLLLIKGELFVLDEEVVNFWVPFGFPWIAIFLWLRPRLKALKFNKANRNGQFLLCFAAVMAIAVPTIISQLYLATATGKMTRLDRVSQIDQKPKTKYYTIQKAFFDRANASMEARVTYSGKYNENLNPSIFLACPIYDFETIRVPANLWLGTVYKTQMSSSLVVSDRDARIDDFNRTSLASYNQLDLRSFTYLERVGFNDEERGFEAAVKKSSHYQPGSPIIILQAHNDDFSARNGNKLAWAWGSFGIGAFIWLLMLLATPVNEKEMDHLLAGGKINHDNLFNGGSLFVPKPGCFVTPILVDLNILVFLGMVLAGCGVVSVNRDDLLRLGGNFRPAVIDGQIWRLATSMFIHSGLMHLVGNVAVLLLVGVLLEPILGSITFIICYFACGIAGGVASIVWNEATVSIGASGAILGMWGILLCLSLFKNMKAQTGGKDILKFALFILGYNLLIGLVSNGVDNADHLGGLVCGMLIGILGGIFPKALKRGQVSTKYERRPSELVK